jgi:glycerophosphoryl diester phosphodiesterase
MTPLQWSRRCYAPRVRTEDFALPQRRLVLALALVGHCAITACAPSRRPDVVGHRGARAARPENTLPAFEYALAVGADVLELDVHLTSDNVPVVIHDAAVPPELCAYQDGTEVAAGTVIRHAVLADVRRLDCGSRQHPSFPEQVLVAGAGVPTLDEVLALGSGASESVRFYVELKSEAPGDSAPTALAQAVLQAIDDAGVATRVVIIARAREFLDAVLVRDPDRAVALVANDLDGDTTSHAVDLGAEALIVRARAIHERTIADAHAAGLRIDAWTVNDGATWRSLAQNDVDGIITDDPASLVAFQDR